MSRDEQLDDLERNIHDAIRFHREQYEKAVKPLVDQLVQIQSLRPAAYILTRDQLRFFDPYNRPSVPSAEQKD